MRDTDSDNVGSVAPANFGERCSINTQDVPFRWNMPKAIGKDFVKFGYDDME